MSGIAAGKELDAGEEPDGSLQAARRQAVGDADARDRVHEFGIQLGQRQQHEGALHHAWVRDLELRCDDSVPRVEQQIQIDDARTETVCRPAADPMFHLLECREQRERLEHGAQADDQVPEDGLVRVADGVGFVNGGDGGDLTEVG